MTSCKKKAASISGQTLLTAADIKQADGIRTVGPESVKQLAAITADAFRHDPFNNWLFNKHRRMQQMFSAMAKYVYAPRGFCQILSEEGEDLAATMWMMPGGSLKMPFMGDLAIAATFTMDSGLASIRRGTATGEAMAKAHPREPHAYLFTVGVMGEGRGRGLGRKMIDPVLEACDRTGTMAYLENSNPEANAGVYHSLGFEDVGTVQVTPDSPAMIAMKRQPR